MCGIVGIIDRERSQTSPDIVRRMRDCLAYRGPDDTGEYFDGPAALGFRRLSIIDLSTGKQPMQSIDSRYAIVFNGEIYNYQELRPTLEKKYQFRTKSDTEVLLYHLIEHGASGLQKLNGMFAFALWDKQKEELLLARDRFGKKPLYYNYNRETFVFGSEIKSLLAHPGVSRELDRQALAQYFLYEYIPAPLTPFQNIKKVPAGGYLKFSVKNPEPVVQQWWRLEDLLSLGRPEASNNIEKLDQLLNEAVKSRMVADVSVGVLLSGGLDSSTVAWYMRRHTDHLHSFSVSFEEKSFDEGNYAAQAAKSLGTIHHDVRFTLSEFHKTLAVIQDRLDEPLADASLLPTLLVSQAAKEHITVALDGDGADELLYGYDTFPAHQLANQIGSVGNSLLQFIASLLPTSYNNFSLDFKLKSFVRGLPYAGLLRNQVWLSSFHNQEISSLLTPAWQTSSENLFTPVTQISERFTSATSLQQLSVAYLAHYLQDDILAKLDRASMYASLESRTPFLDPALAQFIFQLPDKEKLSGLRSKIILKKLMADRLPASILNRPKKGFGIPIGLWLRGPLKNLLQETLSRSHVEKTGVCNWSEINRLIQEHLTGRADHRKKLWTLIIFHWWHQKWAK